MFSDLDDTERQAFFALLDEYFESRPQHRPAAASLAGKSPAPVPAPVRPAAHHPRTPSTTSSAAQNDSGRGQPEQQSKPPGSMLMGKNPHVDNLMSNKHVAGALGAASSAWSQRNNNNNNNNSHSNGGGAPPAPPQTGPKPGSSAPAGLVSSKGIGGLNTNSKGAAFGSLMGNKVLVSEEEKKASREPLRGISGAAPRTSSTSSVPAPPPPRRTSAASSAPAQPQPQPAVPTVTALYDFDSSEPGDLPFKEGAVIELLDKSNADWWSGRLDGNQGLFPAAYVQES